MQNNSSQSPREKKIANLLALIKGELTPAELMAKRSVLCIQWEEDPEHEDNIYMVDGQKVNYAAYKKATA